MPPDFFSKKIFEQIQAMEKEGNINLLMAEMVRNLDRLNLVWPELMEKVTLYLERFSSLISPDTIKCLKSLPSSLKHPGLRKQLRSFSGEPTPPLCGRIFFPVVGARGQVEELMVSERGPGSLSSPRLEMLDQVGAPVLSALREATRLPLFWDPEEFSFQILDTFGKEDSAVAGESMGLPLALVLYSFMTKKKLPPNLSATAMVRRNGMVEPVERLKEKLTALKRERHFIEKVFISKRQKVNFRIRALKLVRVDRLKDAVSSIFAGPVDPSLLPARIDVDTAISIIENQYRNYLIDTCMENALKLTRYLEASGCPISRDKAIKALFVCYWRRGSCHCHKGQVGLTKRNLDKARVLYRKNPGVIRPHQYLNMKINHGVHLKDIFRYHDAIEIHRTIGAEIKGMTGVDEEKAKNLSSFSQLYLAQRRFKKAADLQKEAIRLFSDEQRHRNYAYLGLIYTRNGDFSRAARAFQRAWNLMEHLDSDKRRKNLPFYHMYYSEYLYRRGLKSTRPEKFFQELHQVEGRYPEIVWYVPALIQKFSALAYLYQREERAGLERLGNVARFFDSQFDAMHRLLGATVRVEKTLYLIKEKQPDKIPEDLKKIKTDLSMQRDIKRFFNKDLLKISVYLRFKYPKKEQIQELGRILRSILRKIPY